MKTAVSLVIWLSTLTVLAQTRPFTPVQPPARVSPLPGVVTPNQSPAGVVIFSNLTGAAAAIFSNRMGLTNASAASNSVAGGDIAIGDVEGLLQTLQIDVEQALPILATLTSGAAFGRANPNANANAAVGGTTTTTTGNSVGRAGVGGVNVGSGNTVGTAGSTTPTTTTAPNQSASRTSPFLPASPILPATGNPNQQTTSQGRTTATTAQNGQFILGTVGTNTVQMDQQTFQLLAVLQNNLQQTLPILQSLSGTVSFLNSNAGASVNPAFITGFSNRVGVVTNRILQQNRGVLLPTGR